jgi:DNA-binding YbaB/EbfC family protein
MFDMIRQAQQIKEKMEKFKEELDKVSFTGSAGNGAVTVSVNGKHEVQKVTIQPAVFQAGDAEKLQDLVQAAVNDAGQKVNDKLKSEVGKMTGGLGLPGLF